MIDDDFRIPRRCAHCDHWKEDDSAKSVEDVGECRESPPQVIVRSGEAISLWPWSQALDYCGRWRLRVDA